MTAVLLLGGCAALPHPTSLDAQRAQRRWPGATLTQLEVGRQAYVARCSGCHALVLPARHSATQWPRLLAQMAEEEVELASTERRLIERFLVTMSSVTSLEPSP